MMLIDGPNDIYMLDRDNQVFQVPGLTFWKRKQLQHPLTNTLVDGEMVVDTVGAQPVPRYLIYDIIKFEVSERKIFYTQFTTSKQRHPSIHASHLNVDFVLDCFCVGEFQGLSSLA